MSERNNVIAFSASFIAGGVLSYVISNIVLPKLQGKTQPKDVINDSIEKDKAKVVHSYDIEDINESTAFCRCWKSSKFPYCDGTHNAHNKLSGDNVGPVLLNKK
ncbi:CDGSH iron-sulfur domain-containing protein 1 isoform X1 [Hydra vulgaris]|uniref:CDGSH iron-sulfur domain-containing protein 1 isoform X2 n=2 Tax=Hydra vulgaris TaxID=6087 RepID=A0ABM4D370_HYDVU|nr:CDGSH iron-sulfur domain-containing protein 1 [Hydra vulgaris]